MRRRFDSELSVSASNLVPAEVPTPLRLLKSADCYQQVGVKYPRLGTYHSYAELLQFGLVEGDQSVTTFVPHALNLRVQGKKFVPDAYLVQEGRRLVVELTPEAKFDPAMKEVLSSFFKFHDMSFVVLANESMLERETEARNWLNVVRTLSISSSATTAHEEHEIWESIASAGSIELGDLIDIESRHENQLKEIALFRLLHRHQVQADWNEKPLCPSTVFCLCA